VSTEKTGIKSQDEVQCVFDADCNSGLRTNLVK